MFHIDTGCSEWVEDVVLRRPLEFKEWLRLEHDGFIEKTVGPSGGEKP